MDCSLLLVFVVIAICALLWDKFNVANGSILMRRWWLWLTVCIWRGHDWQVDPPPDWTQVPDWTSEAYTPSSTCRRCGARSF